METNLRKKYIILMGPQLVLFQISFHKGLGEPQENTLGEPLAFLYIYIHTPYLPNTW